MGAGGKSDGGNFTRCGNYFGRWRNQECLADTWRHHRGSEDPLWLSQSTPKKTIIEADNCCSPLHENCDLVAVFIGNRLPNPQSVQRKEVFFRIVDFIVGMKVLSVFRRFD
ncbi:MAG: hypothetical protein ACJAQT_004285 [Akkermansiaceae bacterium]|jgi:hypothetical protein